MDLTKQFPRSPRERLEGLTMLARTIDKGRAHLAGKLGEYIYDCPMDRVLFATIGVDAERFLEGVKGAKDDAEFVAWLRANGKQPTPEEREAHNQAILNRRPTSDESRARFAATLKKLAPHRIDIEKWVDLMDLEEGRMTSTV